VSRKDISPPPLNPLPQGEGEFAFRTRTRTSSRRLIIGIGNPDRSDDGVGRLVAQRLRGNVPADVRIEEQDGSAAPLIERLQEADSVWLIDAMVSGAPPGTIQRTDCSAAEALPAKSGASSHGLGVAEAIALTRMLHGLPRVCILFAVEGMTFAHGAAMSADVLAAAESLATCIARDLQSG
jgi:hydrogenase maturation protease